MGHKRQLKVRTDNLRVCASCILIKVTKLGKDLEVHTEV